ncbi:MAG: Macrolide export protein MacA [Chloroflexi bacterium]|nr:Macrolide export protein MacA [Chloroflexota bacterium]
MKKNSKKWFIIGGIIVVLLAVVGFFYLRGQQKKAEVRESYQTVKVEEGELVSIIGATGSVRAGQSAILTWKTSGTVESVDVGLGDSVSEGEELASLEQTSLPQALISTQTELVTAQQDLDNLLNSELQSAQALQALEEAEQALEDAQNLETDAAIQSLESITTFTQQLRDAEFDLERFTPPIAIRDLTPTEGIEVRKTALLKAWEDFAPYSYWVDEDYSPGDHPRREELLENVEDAESDYNVAIRWLELVNDVKVAQAKLENAQADYALLENGPSPGDLATLEAQLADAQREWERLQDGPDPDDITAAEARVAAAEAALEAARLEAPFSGTITQIDVLPNDQISAGTMAFRVDDLSRIFADIQVSEVDINKIELGQDVTLTFDAILAKEYHGEVVAVDLAGDDLQGVVNFLVTVEMSDADALVRPGMTVAANIVVNELENVLLVPNRAVRVVDGKRVVYVLRLSGPEPIEITLGASSDTHSEVIDGDLKKGDEIILNPSDDLLHPGEQGGPPF